MISLVAAIILLCMEMVEGGSGKMNSSPLVIVWMVRVREEAVSVSISRMVALGETN